MRAATIVLASFVIAVVSAAACAEGDSPGFDNVGGSSGDGGGGEGGSGEGGERTGTTSGQVTTGASATTTTGSATTTSSTTTSTTSTSSSSSTGTGGAPPCQDTGPGEPANDQQSTAHFLGTIGDSDGDGGTIMGILQTPEDVDWYVYAGEDNIGSVVDPTRQIIGAGIRICKYLDCLDENAEEFECPSGTAADTQGGHRGCCWTGGEEVEIGAFNCADTSSDDARVYMRIDHQGGPGCESYSVNYHY